MPLRLITGPGPQHPVDLLTCLHPSPLGVLALAWTDHGLAALALQGSLEQVVAQLRKRLPVGLVRAVERPEPDCDQLDAYFLGTRKDFDLTVDLRGLPPFQERVLVELCRLGHGESCAYKDLATRIGSPGAPRAVGNALGNNPVAVVVPCHRVLQQGGRLGGYTGGLDRKRLLLALEGTALR